MKKRLILFIHLSFIFVSERTILSSFGIPLRDRNEESIIFFSHISQKQSRNENFRNPQMSIEIEKLSKIEFEHKAIEIEMSKN